jgi:hypothetical protein
VKGGGKSRPGQMEKKGKDDPKSHHQDPYTQRPRTRRGPGTQKESCVVAYRKRKRVDVCMKKRVSYAACKPPAREGGSRALREREEDGGGRDGGEVRGAARADRAHRSLRGYAPSLSIKGMSPCLRESCARVCRLRMDTRRTLPSVRMSTPDVGRL